MQHTAQPVSFQVGNVSSLWYFFHQVPDIRDPRGFRHPLPVVLTLSILALCCGRKTYAEIAAFVHDYADAINNGLPFLAGHFPDAATFYRIFNTLDCDAFESVVHSWVAVYAPSVAGDGIALDGKTTAGDTLHFVAAFVHRAKSVLFQGVTDTKGKELVVGPTVLSRIALERRVITADALYAQRKICEQIAHRGGGYVISVKDNQKELERSIALFFTAPPFGSSIDCCTTNEKSHGRVEERTIAVSSDLTGYLSWPGLTHVFRCIRRRTVHGKTSVEVMYGIARLFPGRDCARDVGQYLRGHWGIENRLHRQRDVVFGEDRSTIRKRKASHTMAILRNIVTTIFHQHATRSFVATMQSFAARPRELFTALSLTTCAHLY